MAIKDQCAQCKSFNGGLCDFSSSLPVFDQTSCGQYIKNTINLEKNSDSGQGVSNRKFDSSENVKEEIFETSIKPGMFQHPFSFKGRIRRSEFGISLIIFTIWAVIVNIAFEDPALDEEIAILVLLSYIPAFWFYWAQLCKRFHDRGCSGAYIFFLIIPIYNLYLIFMQIFADGDKHENEYGPDPKGRNYTI